ncbi:MAG TPA: bifunctional adenosylcobinamide kinase/adenosylcobinamide-phosphate guanylyltransferase [Candidatus Baltobacteraceae bacterium]|jgi:adenosylcobinamide kinase/adenosylcobinamide-phosphate guanylyltransferase|nr:bifunctional adenosylcobinamide kinase/adenosylcobinamide-phosphate guanylyltransferase [Candidatus Baltobacteraceae bacterium]
MAVTLVTGPVRSGKSRYVAHMAQASGRGVTYVATAMRDAGDAEWNARLDRHVADRPAQWRTVESAHIPHASFVSIMRDAGEGDCIVVDALGTWLAARLSSSIDAFERGYAEFETMMDREAAELSEAMLHSRALVLVVAEEVGWDIVPNTPSARLFRDVLGRMKQRLAAGAQSVQLVVCGIAVDVKSIGVTLP